MSIERQLLVTFALIAMMVWSEKPAGPGELAVAGYRLGDPLAASAVARQNCGVESLFHQLEDRNLAFLADDNRIVRGIASNTGLSVGNQQLTKFMSLDTISTILESPVSPGNRFRIGDQSVYVQLNSFWGGAQAFVLIDEKWNRPSLPGTSLRSLRQASIGGLRLGDSKVGPEICSAPGETPTWITGRRDQIVVVGGRDLTLDGVRYSAAGQMETLLEHLGPSTNTIHQDGESFHWNDANLDLTAHAGRNGVRFVLTDSAGMMQSLNRSHGSMEL